MKTPDKNDPDVMMVGIHEFNEQFEVPSNKTVYIDGAILREQLLIHNAQNVKVGSSMVEHTEVMGVHISIRKIT